VFEKIRSLYVEKFSSFIGSHHFLTTVLFILWISVPIVLLLQKLKSRIHPTVITLAGLAVLSLTAAIFPVKGQTPHIGHVLTRYTMNITRS